MGRVVYSMNVSLDGFVATPDGGVDWGRVDEEVIGWFADRTRDASVLVYGRRLWELMAAYGPTGESDGAATDAMREFARAWVATPKVVVSSTLERVEAPGEIDVGGPTLAASLARAGLIDEYRPVVHPVVLGAGLPFLPAGAPRTELELATTHRFGSGTVLLGCRAPAGYDRGRP